VHLQEQPLDPETDKYDDPSSRPKESPAGVIQEKDREMKESGILFVSRERGEEVDPLSTNSLS
jgi:hypothetical protein